MDEARLAEIEHGLTEDGSHILCDGQDDVIDLLAEVRRLQALLEPSKTSGRYEDGRDYAYAEIIRIMDEAEDDFEAFGQIANLVGWTSPDWAIEHGAD